MGKVTVNGKEFITKGPVTIIADGYELDLRTLTSKIININVEGDVEAISLLHAKAKINGNVGILEAEHSNVNVEGNGAVSTLQAGSSKVILNGNINGDVAANILKCHDIQGNVDCGYLRASCIHGEIHRVNGGVVDFDVVYDAIHDDDDLIHDDEN